MSNPKDIMSAIASVIGENAEEATVTKFLDTGYAELNSALSGRWDGGFPVGRITELAGPSQSGKTALATMAMIGAQRQGGVACFMDHERSWAGIFAGQLGLDRTPGRFIYKQPKTFEESIGIFQLVCSQIRDKKLIDPEAPICFVFDSLPSMVPQSALYDKKGHVRAAEDRTMHDNTALARATSAHFPAISMLAYEYNACIIVLNQIRNKLNVTFGDPRTTPGGEAPKFYASLRIMLSSKAIKKDGDLLGHLVTAVTVKNKVVRPFLSAEWRFMYREDKSGYFDFQRSMVEFLEREKILASTSNGFVSWNGKRIGKEALARDIEARGAMKELLDLLPQEYQPRVVASAELAEPDEELTDA